MHGLDKEIRVEPYLGNITVADNLFRAAKNNGIRNVVNASSVAACAHICGRATTESDAAEPSSVYGVIKLAIERLAALYNRKHGMSIKSLRYSQGIGKLANLEDGRFWSVLQYNCLHGLPIPIWGSGESGRDVIYVRDMAKAAICAVEHPECMGVYNIGSGRLSTNLEIAETYCKVFNNQAGLRFVGEKEEKADIAWLDCTKAQRELGFVPDYSLEAAIADIKNLYVQEGYLLS